jgi:hypothetical protein
MISRPHPQITAPAQDRESAKPPLRNLLGQALRDWLKNQGDICVESSEDIQQIVIELMDQFHNPLKPEKGINGADPFVIGLAVTQGGSKPWTVVSGEKAGSNEAPKIPWVCGHWNGPAVPHMTFLELIVAEGWELS